MKYEVRKKNLSDLINFKKMFGDSLESLWASEGVVNFESCAKVVYTCLVDQSIYKAKDIIEYDIEGNATETKIGGYKLLLQDILTDEDRAELLEAFVYIMTEDVKKKNP